jgi:hypothetical protein
VPKRSPSVQALFDDELAIDLTDDLRDRGFRHLRVRRRRGLLVIESGPAKDPVPHARFRHDTVHLWRLEMLANGGRWEPTPYRDLIETLLDALIRDFSWTLAPIASPPANPSRTSGRKY